MISSRLAFDTNTVMALWFFEDPALADLHHFIERARPQLVTRADAVEELRRVLAYRQFAISPQQQSSILTQYTQRCFQVQAPDATACPLPVCRDRDDQKFLEIARDGGVSHLVTRDKALLRLNRHRLIRPLYAIVKPETLMQQAVCAIR